MTEMLLLMGAQMTLGSISAGVNASKQQSSIKSQVCEIAQAMDSLTKNTKFEIGVIDEEIIKERLQSQKIAFQIIDIQNQIKQGQKNFKKTYNIWVTMGIIFIILIAFLLTFKKVILKASTSPK